MKRAVVPILRLRTGGPFALAVVSACLPPDPSSPCDTPDEVAAIAGTVVMDGPCALGVESPTRLLVTTTDFATGAVSVVDALTFEVTPDVALGSTDAIPSWHDGRGLLLHRWQIDSLQVLDPTRRWATAADIPITATCSAAPNPQAIAFDPDGLGYVTQLDVPELAVVDLRAAPGQGRVGTIDLRAVPDADGNPDFGAAVACGSVVWVVAQRLDAALGRIGPDEIVAVDTAAGRVVDLDPDREGAQGLLSRGAWLRQLRRDPKGVAGHTLLGLSNGIERFDLAGAQVSWAVAPERFADAGIGAPFQPQAFAISSDGIAAYVAAYDADFEQVRLYHVGLDDNAPQTPTPFADGFDSVERTLERVGDRLWYGSTQRSAPGLWVFDLAADPPVPLAGPLSTGLPPFSLVAIP